jgi:glycosyltransferase involved in cell wall biosynthesis
MARGQLVVSVVLATHNRARLLERLLHSLRDQTLPRDAFEVIVVDDASPDGETAAVLERELEAGELDLRVIRRPRSEGPGAARNEGWRSARAPLVAFTDDDCVATPGWLAAGLDAWRESPDAFVQGRTEPVPEEFPRFDPFSHTVEIRSAGPSFETCNIFYSRELLERLGGFDALSFTGPGGEDTDLGWRAVENGADVRYEHAALVHHAVQRLGPIGRLRLAARWSETILCFARHPGLRRHLVFGIFWKQNHYLLARAALALLLPRRFRLLRLWLAAPYVTFLTRRRSGPLLAPFLIALDLVEILATVRGAIRYRTLVI